VAEKGGMNQLCSFEIITYPLTADHTDSTEDKENQCSSDQLKDAD